MDQRQTQIREGAGLDESRLNQEFLDLLRKWSSPVLILAAVLVFGYWGWQKFQESRLNRLNTAFDQLEAAGAGNDPSPDSLESVAADYGGVRAVGTLARLEAADVYLRAVRLGLKIGAQPEPGEAGQQKFKPEDTLSDSERAEYLSDAEALYKQVVVDTQAKPGMSALHTINGLYGLAAVAESRADMEAAKSYYEQVIAAAQKAGLDAHAVVAKARIDGLDSIKTPPKVYNAADLPKPPPPPAPPAPPPTPTPGDNAPADGDSGAPAPADQAPADQAPPGPESPPPGEPSPPPADQPKPDEPK